MKNQYQNLLLTLALLLMLNSHSTALAQGTAFTYQGQIQNNGSPASGTYNLTFMLFTTNSGGTAVAGPVTNSAVAVSNGLFTVMIDFGSSVWNGQTNWLQIGVETNNATSFTTLSPRQQVTPTPYAITAESLNGTILASQLTSIGNTNGGSANFFEGSSGNATTSGSDNTADGMDALNANMSGSGNSANGVSALYSNTSGSQNTADGGGALGFNTSGSNNIALGYLAGLNISTGSSNIDIGNPGVGGDTSTIRIGSTQTATYLAGVIYGNGGGLTNLNASQLTSTAGSIGNYFVGPSGNAAITGFYDMADGPFALANITSGSYNTAYGISAMEFDTSGSQNTAVGIDTLNQNISGSGNTAAGYSALFNVYGSSNNIALGNKAGFNITTGSSNIDIGNFGVAGDTNTTRIGSTQTATYLAGVIYGNGGGLTNLSASQLTSTAGSIGNYFVGPSGNAAITGFYNMADGPFALANITSGSYNTAYGISAMEFDTNGSQNTAVGIDTLNQNIGGSGNTAVGYSALFNVYGSSNNIALGNKAGFNITTGSSNIDIGNFGVAGDTNTIRIGSTQTATYLVGTVYANGVALTSDRNAKENFTAINARSVLDKVASLPITEWNYKTDTHAEHIGPMAQDFKAAFGLDGPDDKHISVVDEGGVALAAVQGLNQKLETENAELKRENNLLAKRLDDLEAKVRSLAQKN